MIRFAYTILYVKDVAGTLKFYEKAFALKRKFMAEDKSYAELLCGDTTLAFASLKLAKSNLSNGFQPSSRRKKPFAIEIGFTAPDVGKAVKLAVKAGAKLTEKAREKPWGQTVAYVRDPDGFLIEICSPMNV